MPSVIQSASGDNGGTATASYTLDFGSSITAGNGVVAAVSGAGGISSVAPLSGPDTFTAAVGGGGFAAVYYCLSSAGGYAGITAGQGSSNPVALWLWEVPPLSGADRTASGSGSGSSYTSGSTSTTAQASEFWAGIVTDPDSSGTTAPGSPWTGSAFSPASGSAAAGYRIVAATGTASFAGTLGGFGGDNYYAAVATFKFASAASAIVTRRNLSQAVNRAVTY